MPLITIQGLAFGGGLFAVAAVALLGMLIGHQQRILVLALTGIPVAVGPVLDKGITACIPMIN